MQTHTGLRANVFLLHFRTLEQPRPSFPSAAFLRSPSPLQLGPENCRPLADRGT